MADNVAVTDGAYTADIATDDAGAAGQVQIVKLAISTDGSATLIPAEANNGLDVDVTRVSGNVTVVQGTAANLNVTEASAATVATAVQLIDDIVYVDDTGTHSTGNSKGALIMAAATPTDGSVNANDIGAVAMTTDRKLHVSVQDALPAGTAAIGKLAANTGVDIGDVDVTSIVPGTGATNLGKAEDSPHNSTDVGVMALAVRNDAGTAFAADGDYVPLSVDSSGAVRVTGGGGGTQYTEGDTDASITGSAILWEDGSDTLRAVSTAKPLPTAPQSLPAKKLTYAASSALTQTNLDGIASSSTWVAGWESGAIDNSSNLYIDYIINAKIQVESAGLSAGEIRMYLVAELEDSSWPDVFDGTESTETITDTEIRDAICRLAARTVTDTNASRTYYLNCPSAAYVFNGTLPRKFVIFITQSTGTTLETTGDPNQVYVKGVYLT